VLLDSKIKVDPNILATNVDVDALSILDEVENLLEDEAKVRLPDVPQTIPHVRSKPIDRNEQVFDGGRVLVES